MFELKQIRIRSCDEFLKLFKNPAEFIDKYSQKEIKTKVLKPNMVCSCKCGNNAEFSKLRIRYFDSTYTIFRVKCDTCNYDLFFSNMDKLRKTWDYSKYTVYITPFN